MARRFVSLTVSMMLVLFLFMTGCSSSADPQGSGDQVELKLGFYSSGASDAKMQELIDGFMKKHPNIKVTTETAPYGQFFQKLDTRIAAGNAPDLWLSDGVLVAKYAERGAIKDLTEWIDKDLNKEDYYGLDFNKDAEGRYWAVPQGIQIGVLFYNKDLFDQAGVSYPTEDWTYDDLKKAAAKLTLDSKGKNADDPKFDGKSVSQFGLTFFSITEGWFPVMKAYGGGVLDPTMKKSIIDSPENRQAVEWMVDGMKRGIITDPSDLKSFKSPMEVFPSKSAAMWFGIYARVLAANESGLNHDVTLLPKGPSGKRFAPVIANSWVINNKADDAKAKAAWEWIKYWVTEDEVQSEWAVLGEAVPVKKSVANSDAFLNSGNKKINKQAFLDSFEFAGTLDTNAVWNEWVQVFGDNVDRAFLGEVPVNKALGEADRGVQKTLDQFYQK
ncbi:ABC transporter substrate-binding protein [Kroppenstedtia eburnea]|nr:sugar ABC transporter substrate-binding protein [Kroppenstedtia eburnea]